MKWLVQDSSLNYNNTINDIEAMIGNDHGFLCIGYLKSDNFITGFDDSSDRYIFRGSVMLTEKLYNKDLDNKLSDDTLDKLKKSIFYNPSHFDQYWIQTNTSIPMLNHDAIFASTGDEVVLECDSFIKPSSDLKAFAAFKATGGSILSSLNIPMGYDGKVLICSQKPLGREYRVVVCGDMMFGSLYCVEGKGTLSEIVPTTIFDFVKDVNTAFKPDDIFVIDIMDNNGQLKIIEYNCFNASGLYAIDRTALFSTIWEYTNAKT